MNPQTQVCPHCGAEGKSGQIAIHSHRERRYRCRECRRTFVHSSESALYGLKKPEVFALVVSLLAHGCPAQAVMVTYGLSDKTVRDWQRRAGMHCEGVHEQMVMQRQWDLQHIQADEMKVTTQAGVLWVALVLVVSTRLWLGGAVSATRGKDLIRACLHYARCCALRRPLLVAVDGLNMYVKACQQVFRTRERLPGERRSRWFIWSEVVVTQVVKKRGGKRGVIERLVAQGDEAQAARLRQQSGGGKQINSAFIERLNATFRQRLAPLHRRTRAQVRQADTLKQAVFVQGCVYNFCTAHTSLALALELPHKRRRWVQRTPAMAAGLTDHCWSVHELLSFKLPRGSLCPSRYPT